MPYWSPGTGGSTPTPASIAALGFQPYNPLVGPAFAIWQRGNGPFTANGAYTADRTVMVEAGTDAIQIDRETTIIPTGALNSLKCAFTLGTGAGASRVYQQLGTITINEQNYKGYCGRVVSYAAEVRSNTANAVRLMIETDGTGGTTTFSSFHTGGSTFETLIVSGLTVPADATYIRVGLALAASATNYYTNQWFGLGTWTTNPYAPITFASDIDHAQRFYEVQGGLDGGFGPMWQGYEASAGAQTYRTPITFVTRKAVLPTGTTVGTWNLVNATGPACSSGGFFPSKMGYNAQVNSAATGSWQVYQNSVDDNFTFEGNP